MTRPYPVHGNGLGVYDLTLSLPYPIRGTGGISVNRDGLLYYIDEWGDFRSTWRARMAAELWRAVQR